MEVVLFEFFCNIVYLTIVLWFCSVIKYLMHIHLYIGRYTSLATYSHNFHSLDNSRTTQLRLNYEIHLQELQEIEQELS